MIDEELIKHYYQKKDWLFIVEIASIFLFLLIMAYSFSWTLSSFVQSLTENSITAITLYLFLFYLFYIVFIFPLRCYEDFYLARKINLLESSLKEWLKQFVKFEALRFCLLLIIVQAIYFFLETSYKLWWCGVALTWIFFRIFLIYIIPQYLVSLIYKIIPLNDEDLKKRLMNLANKTRLKISNVYVINFGRSPKKAKVFFQGLHPSYRLILSDTLLDYAKEETEFILARELARQRFAHARKLLVLESVLVFLGFYVVHLVLKQLALRYALKPISGVASFPFLSILLLILIVLIKPILNAYSRGFEKKADEFALKLTRLPEALVSLLIRSGKQDFKDPRPNWFIETLLYSQPPIAKRMLLAEDYAQTLSHYKDKRKT